MKQNIHPIKKEIDLFISHLESLRESFPVSMLVLEGARKSREEELKKFIDEKGEIKKENGKSISLSIDPKFYRQLRDKHSRANRFRMAQTLVPRSLFVSMISQYDAYLGRLLRTIFLLKPEGIMNSEKTITFKEVCSFSSIEEFKESAIRKEVETVLRSSHEDQFVYMENKFKVSLKSGLDIWPNFLEITERRNLFVHADGIVSKQYLDVCKNNGIATENMIEGETNLEVSRDYFIKSYDCLFEIGLKLGQVLWRKIFSEEIEEADDAFTQATFNLIYLGEYELACKLLDSACNMWKNKFSNELYESFTIVNCAQSHKWALRPGKCKEIMDKYDCSAKGDDFRLAKAVLNEDWDESVKIMRRIGSSGSKIKENSYRDWPLFKELIQQDIFLTTYKDIFNQEFERPINLSDELDLISNIKK